jgi:hypothetical protein
MTGSGFASFLKVTAHKQTFHDSPIIVEKVLGQDGRVNAETIDVDGRRQCLSSAEFVKIRVTDGEPTGPSATYARRGFREG